MIALCIDDEPILLDWLFRTVFASPDIDYVESFTNEAAALCYAKAHPFDIAFIDVELRTTDGLTVAERLRQIKPDCGIVFCTGHASYAVDAISRLRVDGYLLKPIDSGEVQREIDRFKERYRQRKSLLTVDISHSINVYDRDGDPLCFRRVKTEQLLAVLLEQSGESLSTRELCDRMWQDNAQNEELKKKNENYLTQLLSDLRHTLKECGAQDVLKKTDKGYALRMSLIDLHGEE